VLLLDSDMTVVRLLVGFRHHHSIVSVATCSADQSAVVSATVVGNVATDRAVSNTSNAVGPS